MRYPLRLIVVLLALLSLFAAACGSDDELTDDGDEAVAVDSVDAATDETIDSSDDDSADNDSADTDAADTDETAGAGAIISLSPTATEMLFAVGAGDQVIAVDAFSNFPADAPVTDLSGWDPNVEAIAGYEPDLVISSAPIEGLDALGIDTMVLPAAVTLDDVYTQIEQIGVATGQVGEAAEVVLGMQTDIDAVLAALPEREEPLTYYHEIDNTLYTVTSSTFIGEVYTMLGLVNAADAADPDGAAFGYPQLNEEYLVTANPDVILLADTICCEQSAASVAARPGWDQLAAVQNGNIIELNDDVASRWGPRLVELIETVGNAVAEIEVATAS